MKSEKEIMIFFDLEGTIIEEELGNINIDKINSILESISRLEENANAKANIHIVSPVFMDTMEKIVDKLDTIIIKYNMNKGKRLREIQSAVAYPKIKFIEENFLYDRIIPMKMLPIANHGEKDKYGKFDYVRNWIETMQDKIAFSIYGGNGFNDLKAMEYIKQNKGFIICPENSYAGVKKIADYVSEKHAADGIKDGIDFINAQIEKRKTIEETKKGDTQGDDWDAR